MSRNGHLGSAVYSFQLNLYWSQIFLSFSVVANCWTEKNGKIRFFVSHNNFSSINSKHDMFKIMFQKCVWTTRIGKENPTYVSLKPGFLGFRFLLDHQILITVTVFSSVCVCVCVSQVVFDRDYSDFNHLTKRRSINVHLKETKKKEPLGISVVGYSI